MGLKNLKIRLILFDILVVTLLQSCTPTPSETAVSGEAQGTTYHIKFVADANQQLHLDDIKHQITEKLANIDVKLSNYRPDSEISQINQAETTNWLKVSPEIIELLEISKIVSDKSQGCFDLTVKALFDLWGFSKHEPKIPNPAAIEQLKPHMGMDLIEIDKTQSQISKKDPHLKIDLSAIAQGYSVGQLAILLENIGLKSYMVEIGGEMMVKGSKADGNPWRIGIESPDPEKRSLFKTLLVKGEKPQAVMTAGTYRNYFEVNGQVYSHILNPKTGWPVTHHLRSVTVVHDDPAWADAWDTALLCMGEEETKKLVESENLKAFLIFEENKQFLSYASQALIKSLQLD